jgi:hypothetical protein
VVRGTAAGAPAGGASRGVRAQKGGVGTELGRRGGGSSRGGQREQAGQQPAPRTIGRAHELLLGRVHPPSIGVQATVGRGPRSPDARHFGPVQASSASTSSVRPADMSVGLRGQPDQVECFADLVLDRVVRLLGKTPGVAQQLSSGQLAGGTRLPWQAAHPSPDLRLSRTTACPSTVARPDVGRLSPSSTRRGGVRRGGEPPAVIASCRRYADGMPPWRGDAPSNGWPRAAEHDRPCSSLEPGRPCPGGHPRPVDVDVDSHRSAVARGSRRVAEVQAARRDARPPPDEVPL